MRLRGKLATVAAVLVTVCVACGGDDEAAPAGPDGGTDTVTEDYCTKYCAAQASSGTLRGSRAQCLADCCKNVEGGCPSLDAGATDGEEDAGSVTDGGPTCAQPCGTACCKSTEGCLRGATPTCVKTCKSGADCPANCCAPATNEKGDPVGPYICKPFDGASYGCCSGLFGTKCSDGFCCVGDTSGNHFCSRACASNGSCGAGHCTEYDFNRFYYTQCSGPLACGP